MTTEELRALPYHEYLQTDHWKRVRSEAYRRANYECQHCGRGDTRLNAHHVDQEAYDHRGEERPRDIMVLDDECHRRYHTRPNQYTRRFERMMDGVPVYMARYGAWRPPIGAPASNPNKVNWNWSDVEGEDPAMDRRCRQFAQSIPLRGRGEPREEMYRLLLCLCSMARAADTFHDLTARLTRRAGIVGANPDDIGSAYSRMDMLLNKICDRTGVETGTKPFVRIRTTGKKPNLQDEYGLTFRVATSFTDMANLPLPTGVPPHPDRHID